MLLDKVRGATLGRVFAAENLQYGWYRPWSRELHYWVFERLFGTERLPYHLALVALWIGAMALYFLLVRRLAGRAAAALAVCGAASMAAWGLPLEWGAGAQELWGLLWSLGALLAFASRRSFVAAIAFSLALLSKESAAVVPAIALALALLADRDGWRPSLARVAPMAAIAAAWALLHPALGGSLWWARALPPLPAVRTPPLEALRLSLLALVNLDLVPAPASGWPGALLLAAPGAIVLAALAALVARAGTHPGARAGGAGRARLLAMGAAWTGLGWLPLLMRSVVWQPYYVLMGALGAWVAGASLLEGRRRLAATVMLALALLGGVRAGSRADNWGNEQQQRDGKRILALAEASLAARHPALPRHTRIYFTGLPVRTVFVLGHGDTPALRVWYADPTIRGGLWSEYAPRSASDSLGPDLFYRFDLASGWTEVVKGREDVAAARAADPQWDRDHERLALTFIRAGDLVSAAEEYEKLAGADTATAAYAFDAGLCREELGDTLRAARWYARAASIPGAEPAVIEKARRFGAAGGRRR